MESLDRYIALAGLLVGACSILASVLNAILRGRAEAGATSPGWLLWVGSVVNAIALNGDKAVQLAKGYRGPASPPPSP